MSTLLTDKTRNSTVNSTTTPLNAAATFTGTFEKSNASEIFVSVKTDQEGTLYIDFSPDGINVDSTLSFNYQTDRIFVPVPLAICGRYTRVRFTNDSASNQTYLRLETAYGSYIQLTSTLNSTVAENFPATLTRPNNYESDVAMGLRQGRDVWNKFGFNLDVDTGTEIIASWGGAFDPTTDIMTSNQTFTITYDGTGGGSTDGAGTTGATQLLIYYVYFDGSGDLVDGIATHTLETDGSDVTSFSGVGINRALVYANGGLGYNANDITVTATTDGTIQAEIPATQSVTQQCIFHTQTNHKFLADWARFKILKPSGGGSGTGDIVGYSWSRVTETRYEIYREPFSTTSTTDATIDLRPSQKFVIGGREVLYFVCESSANNVRATGRFSGIERRES